jgi:hypothetical protein
MAYLASPAFQGEGTGRNVQALRDAHAGADPRRARLRHARDLRLE